MNQDRWVRYLDSLTPKQRELVNTILARINTVQTSYFNRLFDDHQRLERRFAVLKQHIDKLRDRAPDE